MPISKLCPGEYLIGTKKRQLNLKGLGCLVTADGDTMHLKEYLKHYSMGEGIAFKTLMQSEDCSIKIDSQRKKELLNAIVTHHKIGGAKFHHRFRHLMDEIGESTDCESDLDALCSFCDQLRLAKANPAICLNVPR